MSKSIRGIVPTTVQSSILIVLRNLEKDLVKTPASSLLTQSSENFCFDDAHVRFASFAWGKRHLSEFVFILSFENKDSILPINYHLWNLFEEDQLTLSDIL